MNKPYPNIRGFSKRNLLLIIKFQGEYGGLLENPQRPVAELHMASRTGKILPEHAAKFQTEDLE